MSIVRVIDLVIQRREVLPESTWTMLKHAGRDLSRISLGTKFFEEFKRELWDMTFQYSPQPLKLHGASVTYTPSMATRSYIIYRPLDYDDHPEREDTDELENVIIELLKNIPK